MKKLITYLLVVITMIIAGCSESFDDSAIWDKLDDHESRIAKLEELCKQMNTNISSLQTIVKALQNNDYVTSVTPITKDGETIGYTITFTKSQPITIYHGEDGKDGQNGVDGEDGENGKDGSTPVVGVKQDTDGIYYWTLNGEWLLDANGNKIKAQGTDGKEGQDGTNGEDGADGKDGITPQLKIENDYWYISYDNGASWAQLGKATGEDGKDGADGANGTNGVDGANGADGKDGDSFFQSVDTSNDEYVVFTLADGTLIQLPTWYAFEQLRTMCNQMNTNIASLQSIVNALQNHDYISSCIPLMEDGVQIGYTITFAKSGSIVIYHGKDGQNGTDGKDGADGKDGSTPVVGVKQDTDGIYYWTLNGEWLLDANGNKIKAQGTDGENGKDGADGEDGENGNDGQDGADGITPLLKIEDNYWWVSYDNGLSWTRFSKATGEDGADGVNGDSFFQSVTQDEDNVYLTLSDNTVITIPKQCKKLTLSILDSQAYEFEHTAILPNQEIELRFNVCYQNGDEINNCQVEAFGNGGMSALVTYDTNNAPVQLSISGKISILAGDEVNKYSRVTVIASDGEAYVMKNITFEEGQLYMSDDAIISVPAEGGEVELNFMSNLDCEIIRYTDIFWISNTDRIETRAVSVQTRTITIATNNGQARTGEVIVKDKNSNLQITYTINQDASPNYLTARAALVDLYNSTNGAQWTTNTNWCSDQPINTWYGISGEYGSWQVYSIDLQGNNLSGAIPPSIGNLTELHTLSLSKNNLSGALPETLGNCVNLQYLHINQNKLTGVLPETLGNCQELLKVSLYDNMLSGAIPATIGNLAKVEELNLSKNDFTTIPSEISGMLALQKLDLSYNKVSNIPTSISGLYANLIDLDLNHNALEMEFPATLCALTNLQSLNLANNKIYGNIPTDIGEMQNLTSLNMAQTYLSGEIPDEMYDCSNLRTIELGHYAINELGEPFDATYIPNYKGLSGEISDKIGNLTQLVTLGLNDNDLSGAIPTTIAQCANLENLYLADNNLTETIPANIGDLSKLSYLDLSHNNLSGTIPSSFWNLTALKHLLLSGGTTLNGSPTGQPQGTNLFTGELPEEIGNLVNLQQFYLTDTNMTGTLPSAMLSLAKLEDCLLTNNRFSGMLPKAFTNTLWWSDVRILKQQDGYGLTIEENNYDI